MWGVGRSHAPQVRWLPDAFLESSMSLPIDNQSRPFDDHTLRSDNQEAVCVDQAKGETE